MEFSLSNGNILKILLKIIPNTTTKKPFIIIFQPIEYTILLSFFSSNANRRTPSEILIEIIGISNEIVVLNKSYVP